MTKRALIVYYGNFPENRGILQLVDNLRKMEINVDVACRDSDTSNDDLSLTVITKRQSVGYAKRSWLFFLLSVFRNSKYDIVFYREIPLFLHLLAFKFLFRFTLIGDIRENLSGMYMSGHKTNIRRKLIAKFVWPFVTLLARLFSDVMCFSSGNLAGYLVGYPKRNKNVLVTPNYPTGTYYTKAENELSLGETGKINIIFSGHIKQNRGVDNLYNAMQQVDPKLRSRFKIFIVGDGEDRERVEALFDKVDGVDVTFTGMVHPDEVIRIASSCDIGFMGYSITANSSLTYPGKLFEYFACGLHTLSTERKSVQGLDIPENMVTYYKDVNELAALLVGFATSENMPWNKHDINSYARRNYSQESNIGKLREALHGIYN